MRLFTIQVGKWRLAKDRDIKMMDTTVKSGYSIFAPTWDMVLGHKSGSIGDEEYTELYWRILNDSWKQQRQKWMDFLNDDDIYALACYCKPGVFCHRHLLIKFLEKLCKKLEIPFEYFGELTDVPTSQATPHVTSKPTDQNPTDPVRDDDGSTQERDGDPGSGSQ